MRPTTILAAILSLGLAVSSAQAGDDAPKTERKTVKKIIIKCEDGDCDEQKHVFVHDREAPLAWVNEDCQGQECDVDVIIEKVMNGDMLHPCQGEDCENHQVFVYKSGSGEHNAPMAWSNDEGHSFGFAHGPRAYLGVQFLSLTEELAEHFGAAADHAVLVSKVMEDSPAARAGLAVGDIVTSVDGEPLAGHGLVGAIHGKEGGDAVRLGVLRDGRETVVEATLETKKLPIGKMHMMGAPHANKRIEIRKMKGMPHTPGAPGVHAMAVHDFDTDELCEGLEECQVEVRCESEDRSNCSCKVNGEVADCPAME